MCNEVARCIGVYKKENMLREMSFNGNCKIDGPLLILKCGAEAVLQKPSWRNSEIIFHQQKDPVYLPKHLSKYLC